MVDITNMLIELAITVVMWLIFVSPALWISGRLLAGKQNAKFTDALWIAALGAVVFYLFNVFVTEFLAIWWLSLISYVILLIIWLALVKHFFDCGWLKALAISIIAIIIAVVILFIIAFVLALIGISFGWLPFAALAV
ncbi:MAG TPA: hypothetical protein VLH35_01915 [Candidatus Acidoferrales bacterium]|nr:hypothetical protein [Candidatus Acidoferrales bacterium]